MSPVLRAHLDRSIGMRARLENADGLAALSGARKRPREVSMIRASCGVLEAAVQAFREEWRTTSSPELGALAAERRARGMAAQDVRTLVSLNGGRRLAPYKGQFETMPGPLVGYIAIKLAGYWSDMLITEGRLDREPPEAVRCTDLALDLMLATARPGVPRSALHSVAISSLAPLPLHPNLGGSVGHGIGLSLHEGPEFRADEFAVLDEGGVYALAVGVADPAAGYALKSAIIRLRRQSAEVLARSPNTTASRRVG